MCLHPTHNTLYWCEKRTTSSSGQSVFCICRRKITNGEYWIYMYEHFIRVNEKSVLFVDFDVLQIVDYYWAMTCIHRGGDGIRAWTGSGGSHHAQYLSLSSSSFAAWTCYCHKVSNKNAQNKKSKKKNHQRST